jgi:GNAT superfamily N-acetyltransferase
MNNSGAAISGEIEVVPVTGKRNLRTFIDVSYQLNKDDPNWVPPLRMEATELLTPSKNPFHDHARMQLFLARRGGRAAGRISAHIDELALQQPPEQGMGPGTGNWGLFEATDRDVAHALIARAEEWLREQGMTRVLAPLSQSVWEEPGLLVYGHDHPPAILMGHDNPRYQEWIESAGYSKAKSLITYALPVDQGFPELVNRIVAAGERNPRIVIRNVDKANFGHEAAIVLDILNDAWSGNWGFVPFTEAEKVYGGKKLRPLIIEETNMIAELDGEPVAFMLALPDVNEVISGFNGHLLPFNWIKLMRWLRNPRSRTFRVPLMGVRRRLQNSRLASQLAFMMIEHIRRNAVADYGCVRGEIGWVLEDNKGMVAIADAIGSTKNREYRIYQKPLA